ncbi:MAG: hypothetical protein DRN95_04950 [Candidatus Hydrothermarchaeota archaeon]|nr:MAG: hypothetical protein DRN95_04950 [Candidatus Hydrothermarchaeota archaeon]
MGKILNKCKLRCSISVIRFCLLKSFSHLFGNFLRLHSVNENVITLANDYIIKYGLLPNDALVLATCKFYEIDCLVSLDEEDFIEPCRKENIHLISDVKALNKFKKN